MNTRCRGTVMVSWIVLFITVSVCQVMAGSFVPGQVVVRFKNDVSIEKTDQGVRFNLTELDQLNQDYKLEACERIFQSNELKNIFLLDFDSVADAEMVALEYSGQPEVEYACANYIATIGAVYPNDPQFSDQWGLNNTGQTGGTPDTDIDAPEAWDTETGEASVAIAILDTGIDLDHPDLSGKLTAGWDFVNGDSIAQDDNGHGTHVAGIAGASTNNSQGVAGVCWGCRLMPVKVLNVSGNGTFSQISQGIEYAADNGARVINLSLGSETESPLMQDAVTYAHNLGCVIVGAAGNFNSNDPFYPAACTDVIAVAGLDHNDVKYQLSGYGDWVDLCAPAVSIPSTVYNDTYASWSGTSMAAPFVSGVAGLLFSANPSWSPNLVEAQMERFADDIDTLNPAFTGMLGQGRVNAHTCLTTPVSPEMSVASYAVNDPSPADADGVLDPDETADLTVMLHNAWGDAAGVTGVLSTSDTYVTINDASGTWGTIGSMQNSANTTDVFNVTLSNSCPAGHVVAFNLELQDSLSNTWNLTFDLTAGSREYIVTSPITTDTTWLANETHLVTSNVLVTSNATLTIQPGVTVKISGGCRIVFRNGAGISAVGNSSNRIRFIAADASPWDRLLFESTAKTTNMFEFCEFQNAGMVIEDNSGISSFSDNIVSECSSVCWIESYVFLRNEFLNSSGADLTIAPPQFEQEVYIDNNYFENCSVGLYCYIDTNTKLFISENTLINSGGLFCAGDYRCKLYVESNTLINCANGIGTNKFYSSYHVSVAQNNLLENCTKGINGFYLVQKNTINNSGNAIFQSQNVFMNQISNSTNGILNGSSQKKSVIEDKSKKSRQFIYVPADQPTIQSAIDAAGNGDTIVLSDGTYTGPGNVDVQIAKALEIVSENGAAGCIIECNQTNNAFVFQGGVITKIRDLTIRNPFSWAIDGRGGSPKLYNLVITGGRGGSTTEAVRVENNRTMEVEIRGCLFQSTPEHLLNGIGLGSCDILVSDCSFIDLKDGIQAGADAAFIENCLFYNNVHGFWLSSGSQEIITNCLLTDCDYGFHLINGTEPIIQNCTLIGNQIAVNLPTNPSTGMTLTNSIVWDNIIGIDNQASGLVSVTYSDIQGGFSGTGNISMDPVFVSGPEGDFYLSQIESGQAINSPCLDSGNMDAALICFGGGENFCLDAMTTRIDQIADSGLVDMGYHYFSESNPTPTPIPTTIPGVTHNTILWTQGSAIIQNSASASSIYPHNNIVDSNNYLFMNDTSINADATYCYWGITTTEEMNLENNWPTAASNIEKIFDFYDNWDKGIVNFGYWLSSPEPDAPGFLWQFAMNPPSPVGAEPVTFTLTFSRPMNPSIEPIVTFGLTEPYEANEVTGSWQAGDQTWVGTFTMDNYTGDGLNTIRVSAAEDPDGMIIPTDTTHTFTLETGIGGVQGVAAISVESGIDISWQQNYEPDLLGYMLYYDTDSGVPYDGTGAAQGNSPIDVGNLTTFRLTNLTPDQTYYFSVRAYDVDYNMSPYSSEVWAIFQASGTPQPTTTPGTPDTPQPTITPSLPVPAMEPGGTVLLVIVLTMLIFLAPRRR